MNNTSYQVALGGIISSLCLFFMFLASAIPILYLVLPMLSGALITIITIEINPKWAFMTYLSVSILSLFVSFDKESALIFIMFFGHYPILKWYIEKFKFTFFKYFFKLAIYNICIIANFQITIHLFGITNMLDDLSEFGKYGAWAFLIFTNIIFLLYDYSLTGYTKMYINWFKPKILGKK